MERLVSIASALGLYAEKFDADTGRHLGNFPQAFSHLALLGAAARIIVPEMLEQRCDKDQVAGRSLIDVCARVGMADPCSGA
jgi:hypothetical protein